MAAPFNQRRTSPMRNLNHEHHVPDPVQSHNGRWILHPHRIAMDSFSYPDILCLGMERDLSQKYGQTKRKENDRPTIKQEKRNIKCESNISYLVRHCLNLDSGWRMSIHRSSFLRSCEEFLWMLGDKNVTEADD